jgi:hypothetical protein
MAVSDRSTGGVGRRPARRDLAPASSPERAHWCRARPFKLHRICRRFVPRLANGRDVLVHEPDLAAQGGKCVAEANALCRLHGPFQDIADLGLGAAAMLGGEHPQSTMHLIGHIPDGDRGHDGRQPGVLRLIAFAEMPALPQGGPCPVSVARLAGLRAALPDHWSADLGVLAAWAQGAEPARQRRQHLA